MFFCVAAHPDLLEDMLNRKESIQALAYFRFVAGGAVAPPDPPHSRGTSPSVLITFRPNILLLLLQLC